MQAQTRIETEHGTPDQGTDRQEFDEIIYHITHDVRSALRALKSLPVWLREDLTSAGRAPSTSVLEILEMIETQAERADRILLDLRTYSRIGRLSDTPSMVPLDEAIADAARRVGLPAGFRLRTELAVRALMAPRNECRELFAALLSNAVKHHDGDGGEILVRACPAGDQVLISVEDDGPGIPPQFRERVFDMMATLRARDECPGSGMGLPIARKIVSRLGGTICASASDRGRGARFEIELPADTASISAVA